MKDLLRFLVLLIRVIYKITAGIILGVFFILFILINTAIRLAEERERTRARELDILERALEDPRFDDEERRAIFERYFDLKYGERFGRRREKYFGSSDVFRRKKI